MVCTIKRALTKLILWTGTDWDLDVPHILGGYRRKPGPDGKYPYELVFGLKPRFSHEPPGYPSLARDADLIRDFELAVVKASRAFRCVTGTQHEEPKFRVGDWVLLRRGRPKAGPALKSTAWSGPFQVKTEEHPKHILIQGSNRSSRHPVHVRRLRQYIARDYGPEKGTCCWFRYYTAEPCGNCLNSDP